MKKRGGDEALLAEELRKQKNGRLDDVEMRAQTYRPHEGHDYKPRLPLR